MNNHIPDHTIGASHGNKRPCQRGHARTKASTANLFETLTQGKLAIVPAHVAEEKRLDPEFRLFRTSTERTAWSIAARHLARGQKDPVKMIVEAIELERDRCVALLQASGSADAQIPAHLIDPDLDW